MTIYVYKCTVCEELNERLRDVEKVYDPVKCDNCGAEMCGKKSKIVETGTQVSYRQGSLKGRM